MLFTELQTACKRIAKTLLFLRRVNVSFIGDAQTPKLPNSGCDFISKVIVDIVTIPAQSKSKYTGKTTQV